MWGGGGGGERGGFEMKSAVPVSFRLAFLFALFGKGGRGRMDTFLPKKCSCGRQFREEAEVRGRPQ